MKLILKREDCYLILIFIFLALGILTKSFFNEDGYISPDSAGYLALAQNLVEGNGFYAYSPYTPCNERSFFAVVQIPEGLQAVDLSSKSYPFPN